MYLIREFLVIFLTFCFNGSFSIYFFDRNSPLFLFRSLSKSKFLFRPYMRTEVKWIKISPFFPFDFCWEITVKMIFMHLMKKMLWNNIITVRLNIVLKKVEAMRYWQYISKLKKAAFLIDNIFSCQSNNATRRESEKEMIIIWPFFIFFVYYLVCLSNESFMDMVLKRKGICINKWNVE